LTPAPLLKVVGDYGGEVMFKYILIFYIIISIFGMRAAYFNGVIDGNGATKYPDHPGYKKAAKILEKYGGEIK
jgi:hypothetical protein